jgi:cytochrome c oxidase cbb3-type subunit 3
MSAIPTPNSPLDPAQNPLEPQFEALAPPPPPRDQLSGHEYDGIQEYDNPTPGWWTAVFAATVVFSFFYFVFYHSGVPERSIYDSYNETKAVEARKTLARLGITELNVTEANMVQWMTDPDPKFQAYLAYGKSVFQGNCVSCHGNNGEGKVGPNFTDDYYKNVTRLTDIPRVVENGANNGAMPAQRQLSKIDIALVSTYVASLRGQNLPSGLKPEHYGEIIAPWPKGNATPSPASANQPATK